MRLNTALEVAIKAVLKEVATKAGAFQHLTIIYSI